MLRWLVVWEQTARGPHRSQLNEFLMSCNKLHFITLLGVSEDRHTNMKKKKWHMKVTENWEVEQQTKYMAWTLISSTPPPSITDQATHPMSLRQIYIIFKAWKLKRLHRVSIIHSMWAAAKAARRDILHILHRSTGKTFIQIQSNFS